ncbi:MAG: NADH-quinone oxidoreductase subunit NuoH [Chloroflexi bacterium]|nr:NADH-quinone oxidoreductase subunit NuoH [Chloroflexota bacterium]
MTLPPLPPQLMELVRLVIALLLVFIFMPLNTLVMVYAERKIMAFMQDRLGPYHTGKWGTLQLIADTLKLLVKEDFVPGRVDKILHLAAPLIFFAPVVGGFVVLPFAQNLVAADLNVGLLFVVALGSTGTIGIVTAGWASNNKYSALGAMRAAAQMVSYEIPMVLSLVAIVMMTGTLSLTGIVQAQGQYWFFLIQPLAFLTYFVCALAETNRNPFDLPEAESELVAGNMTEYSGMRWAMFFLGEYGNMVIVSAIAATLFLGGWQGPVLPGLVWFLIKLYFLQFVFIWIRATLPRLRADQLMEFSWKGLIPLTLLNIGITGIVVLLFPTGYELPLGVLSWLMLIGFIVLLPRIERSVLHARARARGRLRTGGVARAAGAGSDLEPARSPRATEGALRR